MPDDRLIHLALGHSAKINALTDFERLVWLIYKLAADDFGVMRFSPVTLQDAAHWLELKPAKTVQRAMERVRDIGLVQTFEHQGRIYCFQRDWQTWQKITHPRQTKQPRPSDDALDLNTQWLFAHHPAGAKLTSWQHPDLRPRKQTPGKLPEDSGNIPGKLPEDSRPVFVDVGSGSGCVRPPTPPPRFAPLHVSHKAHALCGVVCVPQSAWDGMLRKMGGDDAKLSAWIRGVLDEWQRKVDAGAVVPDGDDFAFWRARWTESFGGDKSAVKPDRHVESVDETARYLAQKREWAKAAGGG